MMRSTRTESDRVMEKARITQKVRTIRKMLMTA